MASWSKRGSGGRRVARREARTTVGALTAPAAPPTTAPTGPAKTAPVPAPTAAPLTRCSSVVQAVRPRARMAKAAGSFIEMSFGVAIAEPLTSPEVAAGRWQRLLPLVKLAVASSTHRPRRLLMKTLLFSTALALLTMGLAGAPASALTMKECSAKYQDAKKANTLKGQKWNDFRKANCADDD
eukprot:gene32161-41397_t